MAQYRFVGEVTRDLADRTSMDVRPRNIVDLFYKKLMPDERCPILSGRRLIPLDLLPVIEAELLHRGLLGPRAGEGRK